MHMKNSGLFIGLGVGLLVGAAIGLYIASDDETKDELADEIKSKVDDAKKSIGKVVKQGLEELDKAIETVKSTVQNATSQNEDEVVAEAEVV